MSSPRWTRSLDASRLLLSLGVLVGALAAVAAAAGLLVAGGDGPFTFRSIHGEAVPMFGRGLYRNDSLLTAAGFRGVDVVVLVAGLPLLAIGLVAWLRGSLRGHLLLTGTLAFFLYQYASMAVGAAFNPLFPVYIVLFGASLFAFAMAFATVDLAALERAISAHMPRRLVAGFLFVVFAVLLVVWGSELAANLAAGHPSARIDSYTTVITDVLDLGVILPATFAGAILVLRRAAVGYLIAATVLVVCILMGPALTAMSISQVAEGVSFTPGEVIGPVLGFTMVALAGIAVAAVLMANLTESPARPVPPALRPAR